MESAAERKINILLVDDRPENLISLAAVLDNPEYRLVKATSGREALKALLAEDFALILLDVQMPVMDGFETAALIKKRERSRNIPIIFITAISKDEPFVFKGYGAGAVDYIFKPFDPSILRSKVAVFVELFRKSHELLEQAEKLREAERLRMEQERVRLEIESLRREQIACQKYRDLVEGIHHGLVWVADAATQHFTFLSPQAEALLKVSESEWRQEPRFLVSRAHPEDRDRLAAAFDEGVRNHADFAIEHRYVRGDGSVVWFSTGVRFAPAEAGGGYELRGLSVDVTHLKDAQETAVRAIQLRDEFLSIASHELKTPLTPLKLQLQILRRMADRGAPVEQLTERIAQISGTLDRQTERLNKLVDELLDVSRINNGKLILEREHIDLNHLVREICQRFSSELQRAGCPLKIELGADIQGHWDRLRVEQVFINLLTNATKYGRGQPIEVRVGTEGGYALLSVKDHGIGISREDQERIFQRFERAVSPANFGGLGLGLYIVSQILHAHGGTISVRSEPGQGSEFTVRLPLEAPAGAGLSTSGARVAEPTATAP